MLKQKEYNVADSNIANLGSELEKNVKLAAAKGETAFHGVGKVPGLETFRIEKFTVRKLDRSEHGQFYDGDSYIILNTYKKGDALQWDVHFWLGKYTTQDEAGTAAYKTVELDDVLGGAPVQHREVQGHESSTFLDYFKALRIMSGGIDSGFKHVEAKEYKPRLLWFNGKMNRVIVRQVPLAAASLNINDVFILDLGLKLYQWNGSKASAGEKNKAAVLTRAIDDERGSKVDITVVEEGDSDSDEFLGYLEGDAAQIQTEAVDAKTAPELAAPKKLLRLSDASGSMKFEEVASGQIKRSQLDTKDVFVFDAGSEVFVWIGKGASSAERKGGLQYAQTYLAGAEGRPNWLPISRVLEGGENEIFNGMFD